MMEEEKWGNTPLWIGEEENESGAKVFRTKKSVYQRS